MSENLQEVLERLKAGSSHSEADIQALVSAIQSGQITLATGERAAALGGDVSDAVIVTGDNNVIIALERTNAKRIQQRLEDTKSPIRYPLQKQLIIIITSVITVSLVISIVDLKPLISIFSVLEEQKNTEQIPECYLPVVDVSNWSYKKDSKEPIQIWYSSNWDWREDRDVIRKTIGVLRPRQANKSYQPRLLISYEDVSSNPPTLEEYKKSAQKELTTHGKDVKIQNECDLTLANRKAYGFSYTLKDEGYLLKRLEVGVYNQDKIYHLTYTATLEQFPKLLPEAQAIISSFKFTNDQQN